MKKQAVTNFLRKTRKKRPNRHAKRSSKCKSSKNYVKLYKGQGK